VTRGIRFLADENLNNAIWQGVLRREPELNIVRAQDVGLSGKPDPAVLELAAVEGRILLTHDFRTIPAYAYDRVRSGLTMPGVIEIPSALPTGQVIEDLLLIALCSLADEWDGRVRYLPLE